MHCCTTPTAPSRRSWLHRAAALLQWALPITTLALIPKCPACFAAYVLLFTGMGLSFTAADTLRTALIALSIIALAVLLFRAARSLLKRSAPATA